MKERRIANGGKPSTIDHKAARRILLAQKAEKRQQKKDAVKAAKKAAKHGEEMSD